MAGNIFGQIVRLVSFGESHGILIGGVLEGFPSGFNINLELVQQSLNRRAPGKMPYTSPRKEDDIIEIVSGIYNGKTTGSPIAFFIRNTAQKSDDYEHLKNVYRPSHADYTYDKKFGNYDIKGGGRSSARETAIRVAAGAICYQLLQTKGISIKGFVSQIGPVALKKSYAELDLSLTEESLLRCPDPQTEEEMHKYLEQVAINKDSSGGIVSCVISGLPAGLGEPVYGKFQSLLASAMMSINAVKGFEYGAGFESARMRGSEHNDPYKSKDGKIVLASNHAGGILGGITTGADVYFRVAFKPISSILKKQMTVDKDGNSIELSIGGRHDVCVVPRAVPIVEAMASLVITDTMRMAGFLRHNEV